MSTNLQELEALKAELGLRIASFERIANLTPEHWGSMDQPEERQTFDAAMARAGRTLWRAYDSGVLGPDQSVQDLMNADKQALASEGVSENDYDYAYFLETLMRRCIAIRVAGMGYLPDGGYREQARWFVTGLRHVLRTCRQGIRESGAAGSAGEGKLAESEKRQTILEAMREKPMTATTPERARSRKDIVRAAFGEGEKPQSHKRRFGELVRAGKIFATGNAKQTRYWIGESHSG